MINDYDVIYDALRSSNNFYPYEYALRNVIIKYSIDINNTNDEFFKSFNKDSLNKDIGIYLNDNISLVHLDQIIQKIKVTFPILSSIPVASLSKITMFPGDKIDEVYIKIKY